MNAKIWAIGGGKGGTGKSFLTAGLAVYLANLGKKVTLIDADLDGPNLHTILKIRKPQHSLTDFFEKKVALNDVIENTKINNLKLVIGDIRTLAPESIKYGHRLKFYRHIKTISSDFVLIDLGAGSALPTLDTFLLADKMIVITLPEITSIDNLYHFIKRVLFRKLNVFLGDHNLRNAAKVAWKDRNSMQIKTLKQLINYFKGISEEVGQMIEEEFSSFKMNVVINQVRNNTHVQTGTSVKSVIMKGFGVGAQFSGYVKYDDSFWKYANLPEPIFTLPSCKTILNEYGGIAQNLMKNIKLKMTDISHEVAFE
jgi:flagellar biosynthesis protein FlhG